MSQPILEIVYVEPKYRPISDKELEEMSINFLKRMRIGKNRAYHRRCNHFYFVKQNGRKEKEMLELGEDDVGNCSVCWKLKKTPRDWQNDAEKMLTTYMNQYEDRPDNLNLNLVNLEKTFYVWLYRDYN